MDDRLLAARLCAGDDTALTEIFDGLGPLVLGLARKLTRSQVMAEDVLQEVFANLWSRPDRFEPDRGSLRAYLGVMTHRRSIDAIRQASRRQQREERVGALDPPVIHDDLADSATVAHVVRTALRQLPEDQRRAVEMAFWQGMTCHEVAQTLGIPEGTVKSRLRLAQAKLRDGLNGLAVEPV